MTVFSSSSEKSIEAWGPTASVNVRVAALGGVINDTWMLTNLTIGAKEITDVRQCFDDVSYIYALGNDQGQCSMTLTFAIFVGRRNCSGGDKLNVIDQGLNSYVNNRISKHTSAQAVTIGGMSRMGWLTGVNIGDLDPARGICYGTVNFIMQLKK